MSILLTMRWLYFCLFLFFLILLILGSKQALLPAHSYQEIYDIQDQYTIHWQHADSIYNISDVLWAKQIANDSMGIVAQDSELEKINKIGSFLLNAFYHRLGNPPDTLFKMQACQQYQYLLHHDAELYCTQFSSLFAFFARSQGLITREIECKNKYDRHVFNETYIPSIKHWVYTDLTHRINYVEKNGKALSQHDVQQILPKKNQNAFIHNDIHSNSWAEYRLKLSKNFDYETDYYIYLNPNLASYHTISFLEKTKRLFLKKLNYQVYRSNPNKHSWHIARSGILIVLILFSLVKILRFKSKKS
ncbi:MAG: hypothetical protein R2831_08175 [Chitinophagaceae bacterium]